MTGGAVEGGGIDRIMVHGGSVLTSLHRLTDHALIALLRKGKLFSEGFGDRRRLARIVDSVASYRRESALDVPTIAWGDEKERLGIRRLRGAFAAPLAAELPEESRTVHVELLLPPSARAPHATPIVLLLAATSEEGFRRRRLFSLPLLQRGIAVLSVENPYYGLRRPAGQIGPFVRTFSDQFAMNFATVIEGRTLLAWLRREGYERIVVSGFSQGGMMAAFAAVTSTFAVGVVPCAAGLTAHGIFLDAALSNAFAWPKLAADAGSEAEARAIIERALDPVSLAVHPPPLRPDLAIVLGAAHDGFVPKRDVEALHRHWPGAELRWVSAGHVTTAALHHGAHRQAIRDALARF